MKTFVIVVVLWLANLLSSFAQGDIIYVKYDAAGSNNGISWINAYTDLQAALTNWSEGDEIWVARGTYKPSAQFAGGGDQDKTFRIEKDRLVYGGFEGDEASNERHLRNPFVHQTILSGDIDNDNILDADNVWHVVRIQSESSEDAIDDQTQLDGFIITLGYADGGSSPNSLGGGLLVFEASPVVQNCVFIKNHAVAGGGGAHVHGNSNIAQIPPPPLANPHFRACRFLGNTSDGEAGGICILDGDATFVNCEFSGNSADDNGGGIYINADGGQLGTPSEATVWNCTFANNSASSGRSIYNGNTLVLTNSVMWDTGAATGHLVSGGSTSTTVTNCNIEGDSGTTNADPDYILETGGDTTAGTLDDNLRLSCGSPSIDAGDDTNFPADTYDVDDDGNMSEATLTVDRTARILESEIDQGAHETEDAACFADTNNTNCVDVDDLLAVINGWDPCPPPSSACSADVNDCGGNGVVDVDDLLAVINEWGPCPGGSCDPGDVPDYNACEEECEGLTGQQWLDCMEECLSGGS